jgi:hypothetical protein
MDVAYKQTDGVAMGSPLGPILADIFMAMLEDKCRTLIDQLVFYGRYVDDILVIANSEEQFNTFMKMFNEMHSNLKVTCEYENNDSLSFLDVKVQRRADGSLRRTVYRKPTWTGQYLNFQSFQPLQYKRGLVKTLYNRARKICSDDSVEEEFSFLERTLVNNGYPLGFVRYHSQLRPSKVAKCDVPKKPVFIELPFKGDHLLNRTAKQLQNAVGRALLLQRWLFYQKADL